MSTKTLLTVEEDTIEVPNASLEHNEIKTVLGREIDLYARRNGLGMALVGHSFRTAGEQVCCPDVAFVSTRQLHEIDRKRSVVPFPPALAVEIVSPSESALDLRMKVQEYLAAGSQTVSVFYPESATADIWEAGALRSTDSFIATCLPGFFLTLTRLSEMPDEMGEKS